MINLYERMLPDLTGMETCDLLIPSQTHIQTEPQRPFHDVHVVLNINYNNNNSLSVITDNDQS